MYKILSFDLFMTLVSLDDYWPQVWSVILGQSVSAEEAQLRTDHFRALYLPYYFDLSAPPFVPMYEVFRKGFSKYFYELNLSLDPAKAADIMLTSHNSAPFYPGVPELLKDLSSHYEIVISTDADLAMVDGIRQRPELSVCSHFYVSEELKAYKSYVNGLFFSKVLQNNGVTSDEILHIGDSRPDVLGAYHSGIKCCHIRRGHELSPELGDLVYKELDSLDELYELLNLK